MKKLIGCLLLFLSTTCFAGYYDLQQQSIVKDTTTINNDWYMRGSYHIGRDTYTVSASGVPTKILLHSSGTIVCEDLNTGQGANELYDMNQNVETTSTPTFSSMTVTNGITAGNLITNSYNVDTQFALVATDTTTLQSNIGTEESARISADTAIGVTTGTLETNKLAKTATFGGDVSGTYDALQVDKVKGVLMSTTNWVTDQYLISKGTYVITGTPAGSGDVTKAGDNAFTGDNSFTGTDTFADINTSDLSMYKVIYSTSDVSLTEFTISSINGNVDKEYLFVFDGTGTFNSAYLYYNGDTTPANYVQAAIFLDNNAIANTANIGNYDTVTGHYSGEISAQKGTFRCANVKNHSTHTANQINYYGTIFHMWEDSSTNITSMTFKFDGTIWIKNFTLWARR